MKICKICNKSKEKIEFGKNKQRLDEINVYCNKCRHDKYLLRKEKIIKFNTIKRQLLAKQIDELKQNPCFDCNETFSPFCMDFDHIKGKKILAISKMIHENYSYKNILKEIKKCQLVCVLCHKIRTYKRLQKKPNKYTNSYLRNITIMNEAKSCPCVICKKNFHFSQMEFDHLKNKKTSVALLIGCSEINIKNEIAKCQILCALCHRIKTFKELNYKKYN